MISAELVCLVNISETVWLKAYHLMVLGRSWKVEGQTQQSAPVVAAGKSMVAWKVPAEEVVG